MSNRDELRKLMEQKAPKQESSYDEMIEVVTGHLIDIKKYVDSEFEDASNLPDEGAISVSENKNCLALLNKDKGSIFKINVDTETIVYNNKEYTLEKDDSFIIDLVKNLIKALDDKQNSNVTAQKVANFAARFAHVMCNPDDTDSASKLLKEMLSVVIDRILQQLEEDDLEDLSIEEDDPYTTINYKGKSLLNFKQEGDSVYIYKNNSHNSINYEIHGKTKEKCLKIIALGKEKLPKENMNISHKEITDILNKLFS